jgi:class 3 adenylate cyclase
LQRIFPSRSPFTYEVRGEDVTYLGRGDLHHSYDDLEVSEPLSRFNEHKHHLHHAPFNLGECPYNLRVYPTSEFEAVYVTSTPIIFMSVVIIIFVFATGMFFVYTRLVDRRNAAVVKTANESNAIVNNLFPRGFRDRLVHNGNPEAEQDIGLHKNEAGSAPKKGIKSFLKVPEMSAQAGGLAYSKPMADFYPEATIMFADVVGFTAWSSVREPTQVFTLLETIYQAFDKIAMQRRVFKVETVGDCYVAVAGLPFPRKDHAVVICRFARECLYTMSTLVKKLEVILGPDTADLTMRIGLHSGPVTAGVLRGDRARFQLFGDTVNTAARIESTGARGAIHLSQETAKILIAAGKQRWVSPRKEKVSSLLAHFIVWS